jgi:hypothetical protein
VPRPCTTFPHRVIESGTRSITANPLSPKSLADNVSHALGIKKDKPKDAPGADNAG